MTAPAADQPLILIAARDSGLADSLEAEVASLGFRTMRAADVRSVMSIAVDNRPDLCLLDEALGAAPGAPALPVLDWCRRLKKDPRTTRVPVIVLTDTDDATSHARAVGAGADDVLGISHDPALLGARVRTLLRMKSATEALDESARRLRELEKVRDDLMKMIVHDLKTPLTSVLALLEILADGDLGALTTEQQGAVRDMREKGDQLQELIEDLLQVWRIESPAVPLSPEDIDPTAFLEEVLREWTYRFKQEEADVEMDVSPRIRPLKADRSLLRRVFGNLFQNAITHSPGPVALRIHARSDRRGVLFTVADSGPGIPKEYQEVIFRTFHRLPKAGEARAKGAGLGLAFCRLAVEAHGGRIWVQSEEGIGSAFHVLLPYEPMMSGARPVEKR
jgi:two-component system, sensor histidine kinase and response regulator